MACLLIGNYLVIIFSKDGMMESEDDYQTCDY